MTGKFRTPFLLAVAACLAAVTPAVAEGQYRLKPGATGRVCLECHDAFKDKVALPFVHTPVKAGDCSDCHNPHTSDHGKLLSETPDRICSTCHEDVAPEGSARVHDPVLDGGCVTCHDPHASEHENGLVMGGNDLCLGCHGEIEEAIAEGRFGHSPVKRNCMTCHTPHASSEDSPLLKTEEPGLCTECHDANKESFSSRHMGYPVGTATCTSCHDPHGSGEAGLLWSNVHAPVQGKMCKQCHMDADSPDALALKRGGFELCRGCHSSELNEMLASNRTHWPVVGKDACLNCHLPHASREESLLRAEAEILCAECHADSVARQSAATVKHQPAEDGECTTCHSPHGASGAGLLPGGDINEFCGTCHDWQLHSSHPIGKTAIDPRNENVSLDCLSCHDAHGSGFRSFLLADPGSDLCVQCHEEFTR